MALLCATMLVFAQNSTQTALLQHGDETTTFYGADAFINALAAASTGDIITLSSGTFNASDLGKAITLRGVGCVSDDELNTLPTIIAGDFQTWNSNAPAVLTVEGIFFDGVITVNGQHAPVFIRCNINEIKWGSEGSSAGMYDASSIAGLDGSKKTISITPLSATVRFGIAAVKQQVNPPTPSRPIIPTSG